MVEFDGTRARMAGSVPAGAVLVDGIASIDGIDGVVLRDRRMLASDGVVMVALTVDHATGQRRRPARTWSAAASCPILTTRSWRRRATTWPPRSASRPRMRSRGRVGLPQGQDPRHPGALLLRAHQATADDPADRDGGLSRGGDATEHPAPRPRAADGGARTVIGSAGAPSARCWRWRWCSWPSSASSPCSRPMPGAVVRPWRDALSQLLGWGIAFAPRTAGRLRADAVDEVDAHRALDGRRRRRA